MLENYIRERLQGRKMLLMTHQVVGYPSLEANMAMLECMQEAGVDLVELQLPFSEPIADGPAFIQANQVALANGIHWHEYFEFFDRAAGRFDFPLLFMGYYNSIFCMGEEAFCERLASAGGRGYIVADLPLEQGRDLDMVGRAHQLDHIQIVTPVNSDARLREITSAATGFIYCVARKGVTGRATDFDQDLAAYLARCRAVTNLPLAVGFGIRTPEQIAALTGLCDIAIVGTGCLEVWERQGRDGLSEFLNRLLEAARDG